MSSTDTDLTPGRTADGNVNVRLANPLNERDLVNLGLDPETPAGVNAVIQVDLNRAMALISAGYVQVDPDDQAAVTKYLAMPDVDLPAPTGVTPAVDGSPLGVGEAQPMDAGSKDVATVEADAAVSFDHIKGEALDAALDARDLSKSGTVAEKRQRLAEYVPAPAEG